MKYWHTNPRYIAFDTSVKEFCTLHRLPRKTSFDLRIQSTNIIVQANKRLEGIFFAMGKGKGNGTSNSNFKTKFATISLDAETKELCKAWLEAHSKDLDTFFTDMVRDGWKTSLRWDETNDCFISASTNVDEDSRNYDVCVTSRSDNMYEAILISYYKIYVMFDRKKLPVEPEKQNWG